VWGVAWSQLARVVLLFGCGPPGGGCRFLGVGFACGVLWSWLWAGFGVLGFLAGGCHVCCPRLLLVLACRDGAGVGVSGELLLSSLSVFWEVVVFGGCGCLVFCEWRLVFAVVFLLFFVVAVGASLVVFGFAWWGAWSGVFGGLRFACCFVVFCCCWRFCCVWACCVLSVWSRRALFCWFFVDFWGGFVAFFRLCLFVRGLNGWLFSLVVVVRVCVLGVFGVSFVFCVLGSGLCFFFVCFLWWRHFRWGCLRRWRVLRGGGWAFFGGW